MPRPLSQRFTAMLALVLTTAIATSGCSYPEQFFVINSSPVPLVVTAMTTGYNRIGDGVHVCSWFSTEKLRVVPASSLHRDYITFDQMKEEPSAVFDEGLCSVRVRVDPGLALLIWETANGRRWNFLTKITLGDPEDRVIDGPEIWKRFEKRSRAVYVIEHKN